MFESDFNIIRKLGICSVDNCSCCGSDSVCRLKPELGSATEWSMDAHQYVGLMNKSCSNYFATVSELEKFREVPRYGVDSPYILANKNSSKSRDNVLCADNGMSNSDLYDAYLKPREFVVKPVVDEVHLSQSASFDVLGGKYGNIEIVGRGKVSGYSCGKWAKHYNICDKTHLHHNDLNGEHGGKVYVRVPHTWCHNPRCPVCFKHGFAVREARNATERIKAGKKSHDSVPEHFIYSVALADYALSFDKLRDKARRDSMANGIKGGALIFHGFRYNNRRKANRLGVPYGWVWSPHFHIIGFLLGGYSRCRNCQKVKDSVYGKPCKETCENCLGFEGRVRKYYETHGCIIKVADGKQKGGRKSIFGTFWYQLHHASLDASKVRFHVLTWFGTCSYHKLEVEHVKHKDACPLCHNELLKARYLGSIVINTDFNSSLFKRELWMDEFEDGKSVWEIIEDEKPNFG